MGVHHPAFMNKQTKCQKTFPWFTMRNEYNIVELRECWGAEKLYKSLWKMRNRKENRHNIFLALARLVIKLLVFSRRSDKGTVERCKEKWAGKPRRCASFPKKSLLLIKLLKSSPRVNLYSVKDTSDETHTTLMQWLIIHAVLNFDHLLGFIHGSSSFDCGYLVILILSFHSTFHSSSPV